VASWTIHLFSSGRLDIEQESHASPVPKFTRMSAGFKHDGAFGRRIAA
jgi:hypothetical protein